MIRSEERVVLRCMGSGVCATVVVTCSHLPDEGHFLSERFPVAPVLCRPCEPLDYWAGLNRFWRSELTIVNVEHDVAVEDLHVAELLACPHPLCAWVYELHWASSGRLSELAQRDAAGRPVEAGARWATFSGLGLVKLTPAARVRDLRPEPWQRLELAVHDAVLRPWHLHGPPVGHHHW